MRVINALLLAALVVVLASIAYDLHQLTAFYIRVPTEIAKGFLSVAPGKESFEQRVQREMREDASADGEYKAVVEAHRRELAASRK